MRKISKDKDETLGLLGKRFGDTALYIGHRSKMRILGIINFVPKDIIQNFAIKS